MIAGPSRVPAPDGMRMDDAPLLVLPEGASLKGMKLHYLAAGGMSVAYKGVRPDGKNLFVKEVSKSQSQAVVSLTQEKALLERLQHPSIPRLQDFCEWRDHLYLMQDFIEGTNLEQQISPFPDIFLPEARVRDWGLQLCDILQYLHQQNPPIIYRDLKPKNVLLHPSGRLFLVDFGIARAYKEGKDQDTRLLGSVLTASPEHYGGQTDVRSDLYTLGATLHYLLTNGQGERLSPFDFPPISAMRADVSGEFQSVIEKCLQRDPEQRFASVQELRRALQGEVIETPVVSGVPLEKGAPEPVAPRKGLPAWVQIGLGLALGWVLNGLYKRVGPSPQDVTPSPTVKLLVVSPTHSPLVAVLKPSPKPKSPVERPVKPRPLPTAARPTPAVIVRPSPVSVVVPPKPRPSPARPRLEPEQPAYPQRVAPSSAPSQGEEASVEAVLEELGLPWTHFQNLRAPESRAQSVTRAQGPDGVFSLEVPSGFRYLGIPQDFSLVRWQRRNFEAVRVRTLMGQSCPLSELTGARQRQFSRLGQLKQSISLQFQGRNVPALVLQVPNRRFHVVEVLWSQAQPALTLSISGGAGEVRFPAYLGEFQDHLNRCRF